MATISTSGLDELTISFDEIGELPDEVLFDMLEAKADVITRAQKETAQTMLQGPYYKGGVAAGITAKKPRRTRDGGAVTIAFEGSQHGNPLAEIAFVNEFGKKNQPARPFIQTANESHATAATDAAAAVYDKYLASKGL